MLCLARSSFGSVQIAIGHQGGDAETPSFTFTNVPPPARSDAATTATFTLLAGTADPNGGRLDTLHDGKLPGEADSPAENFFLADGTPGGMIAVDLGRPIEIKQVNTYSCHPSTRGPQVYTLYAADEGAAGFNARPEKNAELEKSGWKRIASVDTRPTNGDPAGGQYGVSISDSTGSLGKYRHLLFDLTPTETDDTFGHTFYSEIDVVEPNAPVEPVTAVTAAPLVIHTADGYAEITINTAKAPELKDWAEQKLAPALSEWYPKMVAMMPSDGFSCPKKFSVTLQPGSGVAYTAGTRIVVNSTWLGSQLKGEAVGSIIHEAVHVAQQYGGGRRNGHPAPGWFTEGLPDYIRFFKFEPQTHGADLIWLRRHMPRNLNYDGLYRISANFLNYVVEHYDADQTLIKKVNAACRQGRYTDEIWKEITGKPLAELNDEWKAAVREPTAPKAAANGGAATNQPKSE